MGAIGRVTNIVLWPLTEELHDGVDVDGLDPLGGDGRARACHCGHTDRGGKREESVGGVHVNFGGEDGAVLGEGDGLVLVAETAVLVRLVRVEGREVQGRECEEAMHEELMPEGLLGDVVSPAAHKGQRWP